MVVHKYVNMCHSSAHRDVMRQTHTSKAKVLEHVPRDGKLIHVVNVREHNTGSSICAVGFGEHEDRRLHDENVTYVAAALQKKPLAS